MKINAPTVIYNNPFVGCSIHSPTPQRIAHSFVIAGGGGGAVILNTRCSFEFCRIAGRSVGLSVGSMPALGGRDGG